MTDGSSSLLFKEAVIDLCARLKPEAVALADAIAPTDFVLNSVLGHSDGQVICDFCILESLPGSMEKLNWY